MNQTIRLNPTVLVIFGAAGDLTWRKLAPAIYNLHLENYLPEHFAVIGVDGKPQTDEEFQQRWKDGIKRFSHHDPLDKSKWDDLASKMSCLCGDFTSQDIFEQVSKKIASIEKDWAKEANHIYYLATPPVVMEPIVSGLGKSHLQRDPKRTRIVVEKPFGHDLESAMELNKMLIAVFEESQIFRIDHYLGKETVQNILAFRFANALFEPIWDRRYIDHVQITVGEQVGVEHRGEYYDHAGALRDMIQNHLLQVLCLIAMEPMISFDANEIRNKKVDVLRAIRPIREEHVQRFAVRGQYGAGWIQGKQMAAYRSEPGVSPESPTETYAALKLFVDNWRWQDVPFYLRTGKRLRSRVSEVAIQFRPVPHQSFPTLAVSAWQPNRLLIRIQPMEGIFLRFQAKQPGPFMRLSPVDMHFTYKETFKAEPPEAYETLLTDIMLGDATLFMRADQIEASWGVIMPVLESWGATRPDDFPNYQAGTWGPEEAEVLIAQDGRSWIQPVSSQDEAVEEE